MNHGHHQIYPRTHIARQLHCSQFHLPVTGYFCLYFDLSHWQLVGWNQRTLKTTDHGRIFNFFVFKKSWVAFKVRLGLLSISTLKVSLLWIHLVNFVSSQMINKHQLAFSIGNHICSHHIIAITMFNTCYVLYFGSSAVSFFLHAFLLPSFPSSKQVSSIQKICFHKFGRFFGMFLGKV